MSIAVFIGLCMVISTFGCALLYALDDLFCIFVLPTGFINWVYQHTGAMFIIFFGGLLLMTYGS